MVTGHLAVEVTSVLDRIGLDYEAVGGMQFCCGIVHHSHGASEAADRISSATVERMRSYGAKTLIMWCPSCDLQFEEVIVPALVSDLGMQITHATQFLADRASELPFVAPVTSRVALHTHVGHRRQERDAQACLSLLSAIPGIEVVGTVSSPSLGYDCVTPEGLRNLPAQRDQLLDDARALGADTVVTLYHSCHRQWCAAQTDDLRVRNYISLVAESLGCGADDRYMRLRHANSADEIVNVSEDQWRSHGWTPERAGKVAETNFPGVAAAHNAKKQR